MYPTVNQGSVRTPDGCRLAFETAGPEQGPAIFFAHCIGLDRTMWRAQVEALSTTHFVIAADARGHGASDAPPGDYAIPLLGGDIIAILDALHCDDAVLVGSSMGGATALWVGAHHPGRVHRLAIVNAPARVPLPREVFDDIIGAALAGKLSGLSERFMGRWLSPRFLDRDPIRAGQLAAMMAASDPAGFAGCFAALRDSDRNGDLASIRQPTLVVTGNEDTAFAAQAAEEMAGRMTNARAVIVEDAAHLVPIEKPQLFTDILHAFLSDHADKKVAC